MNKSDVFVTLILVSTKSNPEILVNILLISRSIKAIYCSELHSLEIRGRTEVYPRIHLIKCWEIPALEYDYVILKQHRND